MTAPTLPPLPWLPRTFDDEQVAEWISTDRIALAAQANARNAALLAEVTDACTAAAVAELLEPLPVLEQAAEFAAAAVSPIAQVVEAKMRALAPLDAEIAEAAARVQDYAAALQTGTLDVAVLTPLAERLNAARAALAHLQQARTGPAADVDQAQAALREAERAAADAQAAVDAQREMLRDPLHNAPDAWRYWLMRVYPFLLIFSAMGAPVTEQDFKGARETHEFLDGGPGGIRRQAETEFRREARQFANQVRRDVAVEDTGFVMTPGGTIARMAGA